MEYHNVAINSKYQNKAGTKYVQGNQNNQIGNIISSTT